MFIYCSIIYNSWLWKQLENVVYIYNGILFSHKKEWNFFFPFATTWMELEKVVLSEISQSKKNTM